MSYAFFPKGTIIIRQGDIGNDFWITLKGEVIVYRTHNQATDWVQEFYNNDHGRDASPR
jgi:CRP-like cAMP-binding protein